MKFVYLQKQMVSILAIASSVLFLWLPSASQGGQAAPLDKTIQHLIAYVAHSDLTFVRNSAEYTGKEASEHIQKKYAHFRDKIATPEDFIELCASRSLLSRKPYLVINEKGETVGTKEWLTAELEEYRSKVADESH